MVAVRCFGGSPVLNKVDHCSVGRREREAFREGTETPSLRPSSTVLDRIRDQHFSKAEAELTRSPWA